MVKREVRERIIEVTGGFKGEMKDAYRIWGNDSVDYLNSLQND